VRVEFDLVELRIPPADFGAQQRLQKHKVVADESLQHLVRPRIAIENLVCLFEAHIKLVLPAKEFRGENTMIICQAVNSKSQKFCMKADAKKELLGERCENCHHQAEKV
jgi:hypothetical protein